MKHAIFLSPFAHRTQPHQRGTGKFKVILIMSIVGAIVPFGLPTLLVCTGLIPTLVALYTDTDPEKSTTTTVGFMNLAGVLPFLVDLWQKGQTMSVALSIVREPRSWVIMFGAAAIGQLFLYIIPPIIASTTIARLESRLNTLKEGIEQLRTIWGPEVATTLPIDQVRKQTGK